MSKQRRQESGVRKSGSAPVSRVAKLKSVRVIGTVSNFFPQRGFGFISPETGGADIYVNTNTVSQSGIHGFGAGIKVSFRLIEIDRGRFRAVDLKLVGGDKLINNKALNQPEQNLRKRNMAPKIMSVPDPEEWFRGTITWFDPEKGYGVVEFPDNRGEAYLSQRILGELGLSVKKPLKDLAVKVQLMRGRKLNTVEVASIAFLQPISAF